jgi:hypothetical protein
MEVIFDKLHRYFSGQWRMAVLDLASGRWIREAINSNIPYFKAQNASGRHILMQPEPKIERFYLLADDLNESALTRHHRFPDRKWKPGRMVVETSPGNFQVWIHSHRPLSLPEKRYWLSRLHSDPGADPNQRWGRCPGFRNRKEKYRDAAGKYPLSRLIWVDWSGLARIPALFSPLPKGVVCQKEFFPRVHYQREDESATDFAYALALFRRGLTEPEVRDRILSERADWKNHQGQKRIEAYLDRTLKRAQALII